MPCSQFHLVAHHERPCSGMPRPHYPLSSCSDLPRAQVHHHAPDCKTSHQPIPFHSLLLFHHNHNQLPTSREDYEFPNCCPGSQGAWAEGSRARASIYPEDHLQVLHDVELIHQPHRQEQRRQHAQGKQSHGAVSTKLRRHVKTQQRAFTFSSHTSRRASYLRATRASGKNSFICMHMQLTVLNLEWILTLTNVERMAKT